jgi:hypothetical protein
VSHDAGPFDLGCGIDDTSDRAVHREDGTHGTAGIDALDTAIGVGPFIPWKYHHGMPFCAATMLVRSPSSGEIRGPEAA